PQPAAQHAPVPQPVAVALADAVQAAHSEGYSFGQAVARDAPALWLEAVLARKPRMPSDLEARLLQDSSLPIDALLHDEVRHALRRGFWDALERVRH
ncbi:MAG: NYN domain-containing protein, partial [Actinobacteria bacterium]|nr:NYN domain-containing protein [Actinomycetota bacterium]